MTMIHETDDKQTLSRFFRSDPVLYTYHLGDLDPFFFPNTRWWLAGDEPQAALLYYSAFATDIVMAVAENDAQAGLWTELLPLLPSTINAHFRDVHTGIISQRFRIDGASPHDKMELVDFRPASAPGGADIRRLSLDDLGAIQELYACANPKVYFDDRTLELGKTFGVCVDGVIASIASCHVYSPEYSAAAIGAVATHPDHRGNGYARAGVSALLTALVDDVDCISLNVQAGNSSAIHIYKTLGFEWRHRYFEATLHAR